MEITITHTHLDGTLLDGIGREDRDEHAAIKPTFRYSRNVGWYIRGSQDRRARRHDIEAVAGRLRDLGHDVTVSVDDTARPTADVEADRTARAADRADALAAKAARKGAEATATLDRARDMASIIPFGQPILVGHYSEGKDRRYRAKIDRTFDKGFEALRDAEETERRADVAGTRQAHRLTAPATMRRIEKLEADERKATHMTTRCPTSGKPVPAAWLYKGEAQCPAGRCNRSKMTPTDGGCYPEHTPGDRAHWGRVLAETVEQLAHWRAHLAVLQEQGVKVWGPSDFKKGDLVHYWGGWRKVVRVNKKTLSVETDYSWTDKVTFDDVRGCRPLADTAPAPVDAPAVPAEDPQADPTPTEAPVVDMDDDDGLDAWLAGTAVER
jgi:hypothetical protein